MTWFKVHDGFHASRKVLELRVNAAGRRALGLWVVAGSFAAAELTGGVVSLRAVLAMGWSKADAEALVVGGLWERDGDGYRFHDWSVYQPDAEAEKAAHKAAEDERARARDRARRYRNRHRDGGRDGRDVGSDASRDANGENGVTDACDRAYASGSGTGSGNVTLRTPQDSSIAVTIATSDLPYHVRPPRGLPQWAFRLDRLDDVMASLLLAEPSPKAAAERWWRVCDAVARAVESGRMERSQWDGNKLCSPGGFVFAEQALAALDSPVNGKPTIEQQREAARRELAERRERGEA